MNAVYAIALKGMQQDMVRLNHIGDNIANMLTPGFKRGVSVSAPLEGSFESVLAQVAHAEQPYLATPHEPVVPVLLDARPGSLRATGQSLDVALAGQGYLEVSTPDGIFFTRQGNLRLDAVGRLVTTHGYPVMGASGEIRLKQPNPVIEENGVISEREPSGGTSIAGQLKIVRFENEKALHSVGEGLLAPEEGITPLVHSVGQVKQGYLENSNVNSMQEMVHMIQTMRHFESMQKIAQGYDEMLGTAIRKLGDTA
jgi:flagellar basal-body rod protein FlgG